MPPALNPPACPSPPQALCHFWNISATFLLSYGPPKVPLALLLLANPGPSPPLTPSAQLWPVLSSSLILPASSLSPAPVSQRDQLQRGLRVPRAVRALPAHSPWCPCGSLSLSSVRVLSLPCSSCISQQRSRLQFLPLTPALTLFIFSSLLFLPVPSIDVTARESSLAPKAFYLPLGAPAMPA